MKKVGKTENKFIAAIKVGKERELFSFPTKASRDSFAKAAREKGAEVIVSIL